MNRENMHIHSKCSDGSNLELEDIANELIKNNISYAAITDTIDFEQHTIPYILVSLKIRNEEIDRINKKNEGKLQLLKGIEVSSPHLYKSSVEALNSLDLDVIIGSISNFKPFSDKDNFRKKAYMYFKEILKMVEANQIDIVGNFGYLDNLVMDDYFDSYLLNEIYTVMKLNGIVLDIDPNNNLKSRYKTIPDVKKLELYKNRIKEVTLGTNANNLYDISSGLKNTEYTAKILELKPVVFRKRNLERI